jgi:hypothetical protein
VLTKRTTLCFQKKYARKSGWRSAANANHGTATPKVTRANRLHSWTRSGATRPVSQREATSAGKQMMTATGPLVSTPNPQATAADC